MSIERLLFGQLLDTAGDGTAGGGTGTGNAGKAGAGDAGQGGADWRSSIPDDIRGEKSLADIKDVGALAKGYVESQKMIGRSIRIPGKDAEKTDFDAFYGKLREVPGVVYMPDGADEAAMGDLYTKLGRPESPDKYQLKRPDNLPEGMVYNESMEPRINWPDYLPNTTRVRSSALRRARPRLRRGRLHSGRSGARDTISAWPLPMPSSSNSPIPAPPLN
jgi:hypothetical protein